MKSLIIIFALLLSGCGTYVPMYGLAKWEVDEPINYEQEATRLVKNIIYQPELLDIEEPVFDACYMNYRGTFRGYRVHVYARGVDYYGVPKSLLIDYWFHGESVMLWTTDFSRDDKYVGADGSPFCNGTSGIVEALTY